MSFSRKSTRKVFLVASVIGAMFAGVVPAIADNAAPKGDLVLVRNQDFSTFNPDLAQNDSIFIQQQIFEPVHENLNTYVLFATELEPDLL